MFEKFKTILWDFDGVILDSVPVRDEGYLIVLKDYPQDMVQKLLEYQHLNGGLSRYVKFRYFYEKILGREISDEKVYEYANRFSDFMKKKLTDTRLLISETNAFITQNQDKFNMHIVSGSDQDELRYLCRELKIDHYFKSIMGSPVPKITLVQNILKQEKYNPDEVVLIGDSINDFDAANINNIPFYGYNNLHLKEKGDGYITAFGELSVK